MKNDKHITSTAEQLVSLKSFSELTETERKTVLAEMSEDEYKLLHETALESMRALQQPDSFNSGSLKDLLLSAYDKKYSKPINRSILMYNIPLYQAAAAVVLVVVTFLGFNYYSQKQGVTPQLVVYVEKKDTVYIPSRSVAVEPAKDSLTNISPKGSSTPVHQTQLNDLGASQIKDKQVASVSLSRSIKQDSSLKQFMVVSLGGSLN